MILNIGLRRGDQNFGYMEFVSASSLLLHNIPLTWLTCAAIAGAGKTVLM
jgi:hypothetical protein